jgi:predicted small secreted protein
MKTRKHFTVMAITAIISLAFVITACPNGMTGNGIGGSGGINSAISGVFPALFSPSISVYNESTWNEAVNRIKNGGNNKTYIINVTDSFNIPGITDNTFGGVTGITVTIAGDKELSLAAGLTGSLLHIGKNQTVIIRDLDLKGHKTNTSSLVVISGANSSFIMQGSATVSGNTSSSGFGGGVLVYDQGTFTMQGSSTVSGNTSFSGFGGGVSVLGGTFIMQGSSTVSGNTSSVSGGGVFVYDQGTFIMQGNSTVSSNTSPSSFGGGVSVDGSTFTMQESSMVSDNTSSVSGGGVFVYNQGTFTMQGSATVTGNISPSIGNGVSVDGSTFTMKDNTTVSGNTSSVSGGEVLIYNQGTFTNEGGTVYGDVIIISAEEERQVYASVSTSV